MTFKEFMRRLGNPKVYDCVGCGFCCLTVTCVHGHGTPCEDLEWNGSRYVCKLVGDPAVAYSLGIGKGCCCSMNNWREDVRERYQSEGGSL
jgi:hypothetical protein